MSGFKLNIESQFDILYAIFCFNFSLYWCCSWHTKKKKGNDQDLTKYLISYCSSFWIMRVSFWSTNCVVPCAECTLPQPPPPQKKVYSPPTPPPHPTTTTTKTKYTEGSLCICRDGSVPTFSEFIDYWCKHTRFWQRGYAGWSESCSLVTGAMFAL